MDGFKPLEFIREVRFEVSKVTWPKPREVWIMTLLVGLMVAAAAVFFLIVDFAIGNAINALLSYSRS